MASDLVISNCVTRADLHHMEIIRPGQPVEKDKWIASVELEATQRHALVDWKAQMMVHETETNFFRFHLWWKEIINESEQ